jgi:hypothetical protein
VHSIFAMIAVIFWGSPTALCSPPSTEQLLDSWQTLQPTVADSATFPIELEPNDFIAMADGKIAKRRIRESGPDRAMGAMWVPIDRNHIWIAILDDTHDNLLSTLTETRLGPSENGHKLLYQHLDLPWPVHNRQLVVEIQNNAAIAAATTGGLWERSWDLAEPSLMSKPDPDAVWIPLATGSWLLFPVKTGTVVVYHARSTIGGRIPDEMVTRWAMATLDELMDHIADRARTIEEHYTGDHEVLLGGDNLPIQPF